MCLRGLPSVRIRGSRKSRGRKPRAAYSITAFERRNRADRRVNGHAFPTARNDTAISAALIQADPPRQHSSTPIAICGFRGYLPEAPVASRSQFQEAQRLADSPSIRSLGRKAAPFPVIHHLEPTQAQTTTSLPAISSRKNGNDEL